MVMVRIVLWSMSCSNFISSTLIIYDKNFENFDYWHLMLVNRILTKICYIIKPEVICKAVFLAFSIIADNLSVVNLLMVPTIEIAPIK